MAQEHVLIAAYRGQYSHEETETSGGSLLAGLQSVEVVKALVLSYSFSVSMWDGAANPYG